MAFVAHREDEHVILESTSPHRRRKSSPGVQKGIHHSRWREPLGGEVRWTRESRATLHVHHKRHSTPRPHPSWQTLKRYMMYLLRTILRSRRTPEGP